MKKRLMSWLLVVMAVGTILISNNDNIDAAVIDDTGTNSEMFSAVNFSVGDVVEGNLSENDSADFYKFSIQKEGRVDLKYYTEIEGCSSEIYNESGEKIWDSGDDLLNWNQVTHSLTYKTSVYLRVGTYYITISKFNDYTGNYKISTDFVDAKSNIAEPNDSISTAKMINLGSEINGIIDEEEESDIFKFVVPVACNLKLKVKTDSQNSIFTVDIYDIDGSQIWDGGNTFLNWNDTLTATEHISLNKGTYYLALHQYNFQSSMYSYSLSVEKKTQKIGVVNPTKTFFQKDLKKGSKTFSIGAKAKSKITYKVVSGSKYVSVSQGGKVTVKRKAVKGTYKIKVCAQETSDYKATSKIVKVVVK